MQIKKATELKDKCPTYLIYGDQGVGKTSAVKFFPGKKLVVDIDDSSIVLQGDENIDIIPFDSYRAWEEWLNVVEFLMKPENVKDYDIIVIDNLTELFRSILANKGREGKNDRVPEMRHYQQVDFILMDSFRALKNNDKTLVFTAWESMQSVETVAGQTYNRIAPDLRKTIINNILGLCDVIARLMVVQMEKGNKRGFVLQPREDVVAKNRLDKRAGCKVEELMNVKTVSEKDN